MKNNSNPVTWSPAYSVGIDLIDEQHKGLLNLVNDMYNHVNIDDEEAERIYFKGIIKQVVDYVNKHFATEEIIMEKTKFQGYVEHKKAHDTFILRVVNIIQKFDEGKSVPLISFTNFLKDWILTHIAIVDKQYFRYLMKIASRKPDGKLNEKQAAVAC